MALSCQERAVIEDKALYCGEDTHLPVQHQQALSGLIQEHVAAVLHGCPDNQKDTLRKSHKIRPSMRRKITLKATLKL